MNKYDIFILFRGQKDTINYYGITQQMYENVKLNIGKNKLLEIKGKHIKEYTDVINCKQIILLRKIKV